MTVPILVTVPHGGTAVPPEASGCRLSPYEIALDGDTWSRDLYGLGGHVAAFLDTAVPRAVVDLNRAPVDLPPDNPDGVVKTITVDGTQVWPDPEGPGPRLTRILLDRHHAPWHQAVMATATRTDLVLGLDCHTMLAIGLPGHALAGKPRPLICLGNRGRPSRGSPTALEDLTRLLLDNLSKAFENEDVEIEIEEPRFRLNDPFRGGHISHFHASLGPLPWLQLELSRALYLPPQFGPEPNVKETGRLADLRDKILGALKRTF